MRGQHRPRAHVDPKFNWHRVWYVVAHIPIVDMKCRGLLSGELPEISAFLSIVWYTYHIRSSLKFSVLIRTIVTEATIYFLAMVAMQTYVLLSLIFMEVYPLSHLPYFVIIDGRYLRAPFNSFHFCKYPKSLNDGDPQLTVPTSSNEACMEGTGFLC